MNSSGHQSEAELLTSLIGSRICHDLVNPIGAISNGVELLGMDGVTPGGPELELVSDSVAHASARLRFARIAYGVASGGQMLSRSETELLLADSYANSRLSVHWEAAGDQSRADVKLVFLLLQCVETALPRGGTVYISNTQKHWKIEAEGISVQLEPELWGFLDGRPLSATLRPAHVQFVIAPRAAQANDRKIYYDLSNNHLTVTF